MLVLLLAGCGFKLRGQAELPPAMASTYIASNQPARGPLVSALSRALAANGVEVIEQAADAGATLSILRADFSRRAVAAGSAGAVREYQLAYEIDFSVTSRDGLELVPPSQVRVSRNIIYDETQVLGAVAGEELAREELLREAVNAMLRRIQATAAQ